MSLGATATILARTGCSTVSVGIASGQAIGAWAAIVHNLDLDLDLVCRGALRGAISPAEGKRVPAKKQEAGVNVARAHAVNTVVTLMGVNFATRSGDLCLAQQLSNFELDSYFNLSNIRGVRLLVLHVLVGDRSARTAVDGRQNHSSVHPMQDPPGAVERPYF